MDRLAVAALLALACSACGSKGAVSLTAIAENPSLTVQQFLLGTSMAGGFELVLEVGDYADQDVEVSLAAFGIHRDSEEIVGTLPLSSDVDFPLRVAVGGGRRATLSIDMTMTFENAVGEALCPASATPIVVYQGGVTDGDGKVTPVFSAEFLANCL